MGEPFRHRLRVRFSDCDPQGVVFYANHLEYFDVAITELWREVASYLERILQGTKPADLPVQLPTKYNLVINLKTAQALGLTLPPSLLFQATKVIR